MNKKTFTAAFAAVFIITGCSNGVQSTKKTTTVLAPALSTIKTEAETVTTTALLETTTTVATKETTKTEVESEISETTICMTSIPDRQVFGLDGNSIGNISELRCDKNEVFIDNMTYVLCKFGKTFTSYKDTGLFDDNMKYLGEIINLEPEYMCVKVSDIIGSIKVDKASYSTLVMEYIDDSPRSSELVLEGNVSLTGMLVRLDNREDYGAEIYGWRDTYLFLPYAESLNEEHFPALHSELIYGDFYNNNEKKVAFYGETIPFVFYNDEILDSFLDKRKFSESRITFSNVKQKWFYKYGSGWNPCEAEIIECSNIK